MPLMMVIINDIMAYMFGFFMGRTPLIKISPKKTWEGFIGGGISTVFMSLGLAYVMCQVSWPLQKQVYRDDTGFFWFSFPTSSAPSSTHRTWRG